MKTSILIDVVAMIDARINIYEKADAYDSFYNGAIVALKSLSEELQSAIEADIVAIENNTGE